MNLKVGRSMKVNGKEDRNMAEVNRYGRMELSTKVIHISQLTIYIRCINNLITNYNILGYWKNN